MDINKNIDVFFNKTDCPICKSRIQTNYKTHNIPYFGETIFLTLICPNCGFKKNDLFSVYEKEPKRYIFNVDEENLEEVKGLFESFVEVHPIKIKINVEK